MHLLRGDLQALAVGGRRAVSGIVHATGDGKESISDGRRSLLSRFLLRFIAVESCVELEDLRPRLAYELAQGALEVRSSPSRETVLAVRDLQEQALEQGTVVLAVVPVTADAGVREWLGGEFEIQLDADLGLDHWNRPPLFVEIADPLVLRSELRGLLRGQATQSPLIVGRALNLIGPTSG